MRPLRFPFFLLLALLPSLVLFGRASAPGMLGAALGEVTEADVENLDLPGEYGAKVEAVAPGGPAEKAGLRAGDVIVAYNGQHVEGARTVQRLVYESPAGRTVELKLLRDGGPVLATPTLDASPHASAPGAAARPPRSLGVWIEAVNPAVAEYLGLEEGVGMIVREVKEGSPADEAGVQPKDVLVAIGDTPVTSAEAVGSHIRGLSGYDSTLTFLRGNERRTVDLTF